MHEACVCKVCVSRKLKQTFLIYNHTHGALIPNYVVMDFITWSWIFLTWILTASASRLISGNNFSCKPQTLQDTLYTGYIIHKPCRIHYTRVHRYIIHRIFLIKWYIIHGYTGYIRNSVMWLLNHLRDYWPQIDTVLYSNHPAGYTTIHVYSEECLRFD